jgi:hypothetical protein
LLDVDAGNTESRVREFHHEWQTHVSQSDHADVRFVRFDLASQLFEMIRHLYN